MPAAPLSRRKRRLRTTEWVLLGLAIACMVGVHLMFYFWPFRYRQVHPLLESAFRSRVDVKAYHRTYFPHPGFVAEGVTFYRHGDMSIPPLATIGRMTVVGTWSGLILHPHTLAVMRLEGLHVQIPPPGTKARGMDFNGGVMSTSQSKMKFQQIVADVTTLDFVRKGKPPLRFSFPYLRVHNVHAGDPLQFEARANIPGPQGTVTTAGTLGPLDSGHYGSTPVSGHYALQNADLHRVSEMAGHVAASGTYHGTLSSLQVHGTAAIPDFRVSDAHVVRLDTEYAVLVKGVSGTIEIQSAQVRTGGSTILASGTIAGSPKRVTLKVQTKNSRVEQLLDIIQTSTPSVTGLVSFDASAQFQEGPEAFLKRLQLNGQISLDHVTFVKPNTQQKMDSFSARVRKSPPDKGDHDPNADGPKGDPQGSSPDDSGAAAQVTAAAWSHTRFQNGTAIFPDIHVVFPGAQAQLHGTFDLLNTKIHLTGTAALQRNISHAVTGWKSWLLKPLAPFFRHKDAGAVVPIVVTGNANDPKIQQDVLHDK